MHIIPIASGSYIQEMGKTGGGVLAREITDTQKNLRTTVRLAFGIHQNLMLELGYQTPH